VRNSTAWRVSGVPFLALAQHLVGHPARLRGLVVDHVHQLRLVQTRRLSLHSVLAKRWLAWAMTALAAASSGCVLR
jgi:hypothetical protein